jgi:hypothetical protein
MEYLKDLIERLGKALGIKIKPAPPGSESTNRLGPVEGPAQDGEIRGQVKPAS